MLASNVGMANTKNCEVQLVDRTATGVLITFGDGRSGLFPGELLYSLLPKVREVTDPADRKLGRAPDYSDDGHC